MEQGFKSGVSHILCKRGETPHFFTYFQKRLGMADAMQTYKNLLHSSCHFGGRVPQDEKGNLREEERRLRNEHKSMAERMVWEFLLSGVR